MVLSVCLVHQTLSPHPATGLHGADICQHRPNPKKKAYDSYIVQTTSYMIYGTGDLQSISIMLKFKTVITSRSPWNYEIKFDNYAAVRCIAYNRRTIMHVSVDCNICIETKIIV